MIRVDLKGERFENYDNEKLKKAFQLTDVEQIALTDKVNVTISFKGEQDAYCLQMQCDDVRPWNMPKLPYPEYTAPPASFCWLIWRF
jgi:hypothetical protein